MVKVTVRHEETGEKMHRQHQLHFVRGHEPVMRHLSPLAESSERKISLKAKGNTCYVCVCVCVRCAGSASEEKGKDEALAVAVELQIPLLVSTGPLGTLRRSFCCAHF